MKIARLKKNLIKKAIIFLSIIGVVGGGYYFVYDMDDSLNDEISTKKSEIALAGAEAKNLQKQLDDASDASDYYKQDYNASGQDKPDNFRRDAAKNLLATLRDKDQLFDLKLSMEPFVKKGGDSEKPTVALFVSKVSIQFSASNDIDAYNLIEDIAETFPGNIEISSYNISRVNVVDDTTLLAIGEGKLPEGLIKGEVVFEWQGIQKNTDYKASDKPQNRPNAPVAPTPGPARVAPGTLSEPGGPGV